MSCVQEWGGIFNYFDCKDEIHYPYITTLKNLKKLDTFMLLGDGSIIYKYDRDIMLSGYLFIPTCFIRSRIK